MGDRSWELGEVDYFGRNFGNGRQQLGQLRMNDEERENAGQPPGTAQPVHRSFKFSVSVLHESKIMFCWASLRR
jgi:hypothetical protein